MTTHPPIRVGDRVRCLNRESFRYGLDGVVVDVILAPVYEVRDGVKVLVRGNPDNRGGDWAWVKYPDGMRTPHDLDKLERLGSEAAS